MNNYNTINKNSQYNPRNEHYLQQQQVLRPENIYYDIIEQWFYNSIHNNSLYLYDNKLFDTEFRRLSETYNNFPYTVRFDFHRLYCN